jgi:uncharacterized protein YndB with AHSA1/START domain
MSMVSSRPELIIEEKMDKQKDSIRVETLVRAPIQKVWEYWTSPEHIIKWNFASDDWHCPSAENNLRSGGKFSWRMEAKNGSMGFDYSGKYTQIKELELIKLVLEDDRQVGIEFRENDGMTAVIEVFEPDENDPELQRLGWQAILDNFKNYVEAG